MANEELGALLMLLAEWEYQEAEMMIQERKEAERFGQLH
jgi:hypothetical protein